MAFRRPAWTKHLRRAPARTSSPPAPPSLGALVKADDYEQLQRQVCSQPSVLLEVRDDGDFWKRRWPDLLKIACKRQSLQCLRLLCTLKPVGAKEPPPLPPQTLEWILLGLKDKQKRLDDLDRLTQDVVVPRLAASPVTLSAAGGLCLIEQGGLKAGLSLLGRERRDLPDLEALPALQEAWGKWCASRANVDKALELVRSMENPWGSKVRGLVDVVRHVPQRRQTEAIDRLCSMIDYAVHVKTETKYFDQAMSRWACQFLEVGLPLEHDIWRQWGEDLSRRVALATPDSPGAAKDWMFILLYGVPDGTPCLPGWTWNEEMAKGFFSSRPDSLIRLCTVVESDSMWINPQLLAQASTWLRETMLTWEKLQVWGLVGGEARLGWDQALRQEMGENWIERFNETVRRLGETHGSMALNDRWVKWKASAMDEVLADAAEATVKRKGPRL